MSMSNAISHGKLCHCCEEIPQDQGSWLDPHDPRFMDDYGIEQRPDHTILQYKYIIDIVSMQY